MLRKLKIAKTLYKSRSDGTLLTVSFNLRKIESNFAADVVSFLLIRPQIEIYG